MRMLRRRRIGVAGNTLILTAGTVVQTVIALVTVPLYLSQLGEERFGIYVIAGLVVAYFGLLDRGFGLAVQNELPRLAEDPKERSAIVWTAAVSNFVIGVGAALGVLAVGEILFTRVIDMPEDLRVESIQALPEIAASVPLVAVSAIFQGALMARGRIATVGLLETLRMVGLQLIPLGFLYWQGPDLRWLALGVLVALLLSTVSYLVASLMLALRPSVWSRPSLAIARRLFHYGKWVTATSALTPLLDFTDRVVIGAVRGAAAVTVYSIPYNLASRLTIIPLNVIRVSFPRFSAVDTDESQAMAVTTFAAVAAVTAPAAVLGSIASGPFFEWWLGGDIAHQAAPVGAVLFAGFWMNGLGYVPSILLQAQGRPDRPARFHALEVVPFLAVLAVGVYVAGPMGGAIAWSCRTLADALLLLWAASLEWRRTWAFLVSASMVAIASGCGAAFAFDPAVLVAVGVPVVAVSLGAAWLLLPAGFRARIRGGLRVARPRA